MKKSKNKNFEPKGAKGDSNPVSSSRKGWEASARKMHANGDDRLLIDDVFEDENFNEWNQNRITSKVK